MTGTTYSRSSTSMRRSKGGASPRAHLIERAIQALTLPLLAVLIIWKLGCAAVAQGFPNRPLKLIVPMAQGGPADSGARLYASALGEILGQNVVVENRSGASGVVGTETVVRSVPDGYTLLFGSSSVFAVNPAVIPNLRFDVRRDLKLIGLLMQTDLVLASRPGVGANTLAELVKTSKAQPGKLSFASSGNGGITHLLAELLSLEAGITLLQIPFRGAGPAIIGMLSSDADLTASGIPGLAQHIKSGKAVGVGLASPTRSPLLPDVPTFAELGYPGVEAQNWYGVAVSAATAAEIFETLDAATTKVVASAGFKAVLEKAGMELMAMNAKDSAPYILREIDKWARVAKTANIRIEP